MKKKKLLKWRKAFLITIILFVIGGMCGLGAVYYLSRDLPGLEELQKFSPNEITKIYSADGKVIERIGLQLRSLVPKEELPQSIINAAIAVEDSRFRKHWGVSLRDIGRAIIVDLIAMEKKQGASTITQQLARILYTKIGYEKTFLRKIKELLTAIQIERMYNKDEIVSNYINSVYMGHVWGVQAAAQYYFKKDARDLELEESALLAAIINNPGYYSPYRHPRRAFNRRNLVLYLMQEQNFLTNQEYQYYKNQPLQVIQQEKIPDTAPYFLQYVRKKLNALEEEYDFNIYRDGLEVYTTLDSRIQSYADSAYNQYIQVDQERLEKSYQKNPKKIKKVISDSSSYRYEDILKMVQNGVVADTISEELRKSLLVQGALVAIDPKTGEIKAMIGGRDYKLSKFNRATQATRQPGSAFKPIVYSTAIENGFRVTKKVLNQPVVLHMSDGTRWDPRNYDGKTGGWMTLREALTHSKNLPSAKIVQELISPAAVVNTAHKMQFSTHIPTVDAIALGAVDVKPIDLTAAYTTFANGGVYTRPRAILRIKDRYGNVIYETKRENNIVFSEETAFLTTSLLQSVINDGTGGRARWMWHFKHVAAGKTGTTNDNTDAWFMGFTPYLVTGVYIGVDNHAISLGDGQTGAKAALPIWANFMRETHEKLNWESKEFPIPKGIVEKAICKETKKLPTRFCPIEHEYFRKNNVPQTYCQKHGNGDKEEQNNTSDHIF
ncbi:MAG: PBP1A family penicillin-binding protein [Candidatus Marinimicrobia bacterium]|nr:PBP1A family penicillin-binding protein [Candidatus Neomarinimicrobiota bacterium]